MPEQRRIHAALRQAVGEVRMDYLCALLSETARLCKELTVPPPGTAAAQRARDGGPSDRACARLFWMVGQAQGFG